MFNTHLQRNWTISRLATRAVDDELSQETGNNNQVLPESPGRQNIILATEHARAGCWMLVSLVFAIALITFAILLLGYEDCLPTPTPTLTQTLTLTTPCPNVVTSITLYPMPGVDTVEIFPGEIKELANLKAFHLEPAFNLDCIYHWRVFYEGSDFDSFDLPALDSEQPLNDDWIHLIKKSKCFLEIEVTPLTESTGEPGIPQTFRFTVQDCPFSNE